MLKYINTYYKILVILVVIIFNFSPECSADKGRIVYANENKSILVIQTEPYYYEQYTCAEIYSYVYPFPSVGDHVFGTLNMFGSQDVYNYESDKNFNIWIDQFWASKDQVYDWITSK